MFVAVSAHLFTVCSYRCQHTCLHYVRIGVSTLVYSMFVSVSAHLFTVCSYRCQHTCLHYVRIGVSTLVYSMFVSVSAHLFTVCSYRCQHTCLQYVCSQQFTVRSKTACAIHLAMAYFLCVHHRHSRCSRLVKSPPFDHSFTSLSLRLNYDLKNTPAKQRLIVDSSSSHYCS